MPMAVWVGIRASLEPLRESIMCYMQAIVILHRVTSLGEADDVWLKTRGSR